MSSSVFRAILIFGTIGVFIYQYIKGLNKLDPDRNYDYLWLMLYSLEMSVLQVITLDSIFLKSLFIGPVVLSCIALFYLLKLFLSVEKKKFLYSNDFWKKTFLGLFILASLFIYYKKYG